MRVGGPIGGFEPLIDLAYVIDSLGTVPIKGVYGACLDYVIGCLDVVSDGCFADVHGIIFYCVEVS